MIWAYIFVHSWFCLHGNLTLSLCKLKMLNRLKIELFYFSLISCLFLPLRYRSTGSGKGYKTALVTTRVWPAVELGMTSEEWGLSDSMRILINL